MLHRNDKKSMLLVSLGFASGTNNVLLSLSNRDNTLGMLVSLGFASGTRLCLGYYLLINPYRSKFAALNKQIIGLLVFFGYSKGTNYIG